MITAKNRKFVDAILMGANYKDAAIAAGYSPAVARQTGSRLAADPKIQAMITVGRQNAHLEISPLDPGVSSAEPVPGKQYTDPKDFLLDMMNNSQEDPKLRTDAAKALMPYIHTKLGEMGKKEAKDKQADAVSKGKFSPAQAPKLKAVS